MGDFFGRNGRASIAFNAASALASVEVAAEAFGQNIGTKEDVAYLNDGRERHGGSWFWGDTGKKGREHEHEGQRGPYQSMGGWPC